MDIAKSNWCGGNRMNMIKRSHFLLNTLNCIARTAYVEGAPITEEAVYNLSELIRCALAERDQIQTIRGEIDTVRNYLKLQKIRLNDHFEFQIAVSDSAADCRIPNMTLLPIVESIVMQGLTNDRECLRILICVKEVGKNIEIFIEDNRSYSKESQGYGEDDRYMVDRKLKRYFGNEYGVRTERKELGKGCVTAVSVPWRDKDD